MTNLKTDQKKRDRQEHYLTEQKTKTDQTITKRKGGKGKRQIRQRYKERHRRQTSENIIKQKTDDRQDHDQQKRTKDKQHR